MSADRALRRVEVHRTGPGRFEIVNERGSRLAIGTGETPDFTPIELLLGAIGGCSAIDVDLLTNRRAEPDEFRLEVTGVKIRDAGGNQMDDIQVTFTVTFPDGEAGDAARDVLPKALQRSHDQLCTVSRTVELGAPVTVQLDGER